MEENKKPAGQSEPTIKSIWQEVGNLSALVGARNQTISELSEATNSITSKLDDVTKRIVEDVSRTSIKALKSLAAKILQVAPANIPAQKITTSDLDLKQLTDELRQVKQAVERLASATGGRTELPTASMGHEKTATSGVFIPVAALNDWVTRVDALPIMKLLTAMPEVFNYWDRLFLGVMSPTAITDAGGQQVTENLRKAEPFVVDRLERAGIRRVPVVDDVYDRELAIIDHREKTDEPAKHNCIKEIIRYGYLWMGAEPPCLLQTAKVVVWDVAGSSE
ncbi:MAG: hypothetical protein NTZ32_01070 [Planctomycetales bacterium]|nr:hypothetical protein [Planctomycetales bacterium]